MKLTHAHVLVLLAMLLLAAAAYSQVVLHGSKVAVVLYSGPDGEYMLGVAMIHADRNIFDISVYNVYASSVALKQLVATAFEKLETCAAYGVCRGYIGDVLFEAKLEPYTQVVFHSDTREYRVIFYDFNIAPLLPTLEGIALLVTAASIYSWMRRDEYSIL